MAWYDPSANVSIPNPYQLQSAAGADRGAYKGIQSLGQYNLGGQNLGEYGALTQQGVNNPYASEYLRGAGVAGGMGQEAGLGAYGAGGQIMNQALGLQPDVQALINMGFDPQQALYSRTSQQVQDQNAARAQQSGVGATPYGQGVQNQANSNFNIDWQNQQLQRAAMGAGAAGGLLGQIGQSTGVGAGLQSGGIQEYLQGAGQQYNTANAINANQRGILSQAAGYGQQAAQIPQQQIQDYLAYLNQANQNQQTGLTASGQRLQQAKDAFGQTMQVGEDIGKMAMGLPPGSMGGGGGVGGVGGGQAGGSFNPFSSFFGGNPGGLNSMQLGTPWMPQGGFGMTG